MGQCGSIDGPARLCLSGSEENRRAGLAAGHHSAGGKKGKLPPPAPQPACAIGAYCGGLRGALSLGAASPESRLTAH
jgi:hypothetical protein